MNRIIVITKCDECPYIADEMIWCDKVHRDFAYDRDSTFRIPDWCPLAIQKEQ